MDTRGCAAIAIRLLSWPFLFLGGIGLATGGVPILMDTENTGENFALFLVGLALFGMGMGLRQWSEKIAEKAIATESHGSSQEYRP